MSGYPTGDGHSIKNFIRRRIYSVLHFQEGVKPLGIPFADGCDQNDLKRAWKHRLAVIKQAIGHDISDLKSLDVGESNLLGRKLGIRDNTSGDLNWEFITPSNNYDIVTCFEVLEHVMNPAFLMKNILEHLKPGGMCYLCTPIRRHIDPFYGRNHLTEYEPRKLKILFDYVGFEMVAYKKFCLWDWDFMFWGFRPFFRVLLQRTQLWSLRRPY